MTRIGEAVTRLPHKQEIAGAIPASATILEFDVLVTAAPKPCRHSGCMVLAYGRAGYCDKHAHEAVNEWIKAPGKSGRGGRPWRRLRDQVLKRDGFLCQCEACQTRRMPLVAHEVDHIKSLADGGNDDPENLRAINRDCHQAKTQAEAAQGRRRR